MAKIAVLLIASMLIAFTVAQGPSGYCPPASSLTESTPRCVGDRDCGFQQRCCPNRRGGKSCVSANTAVNTGSNRGYTGKQGTGVYCGGVKCNPWEKCIYDRTTRREKCVRA